MTFLTREYFQRIGSHGEGGCSSRPSTSASNFDLTKGWNILRIICGAFMFPHIAGKFAGGALAAGTVGFFAKAGFNPPELWVYLAAAAEGLSGIALVLGICTRFAALGAAAVLGVAVYALQVVTGSGWTWNTGGYEYPVFWAIVCVAVAIEAWRSFLTTRYPASEPGVMARA
jgi:putative oxidoreductase